MVSGVLVTKSSYCVFMYELMMHDPGFSPCLYRGGVREVGWRGPQQLNNSSWMSVDYDERNFCNKGCCKSLRVNSYF